MEKVDPSKVRIISANLGWSDIGTWQSLHEELTEKPDDNLIQGNLLALDTTGSVLINTESSKKIVVIGLDNVAVINTPDAILICDKHHSHGIKKAVEMLKNEGRDDLL